MTSRASLVYVAMFAVLFAGLWVILRVGSHLAAPADLQGDWTMHWSPHPATDLPHKLSIQQSGVFARAKLHDRALTGRLLKARGGSSVSGELATGDGQWRLTLAPFAGGDNLAGTLNAPTQVSFTAHRASARPTPSSPAATGPTTSTTTTTTTTTPTAR